MCYRLKYTGKDVDRLLGLAEGGNGPGYNYESLANLPQINGITLEGDKTTSSLGLASKADLDSQNARIKTLEGNMENLENAVTATEQKNTEQDTAIEGLTSRVTATEQKNTEQDTAIDNLQKTKANLNGGNIFTGVQQLKNGLSLGDTTSEGAVSLKGDEGTSGQVLTSQGVGKTPKWEDLPTHLAQTSQRVPLILSATGWQDSGNVWSGLVTLNTSSISQQISQGYGSVKTYPWYTAKKILVTTDYEPIELSEISFTGANKSQKVWSYAGTQQPWVGVRFYASSGIEAYTGRETYTIGFSRPFGSGITILKEINYTEADTVFQSKEINGVRENAEVCLVLSDDDGKLASQYGLRPWIQKVENKLTFIAETRPSANIVGSLEIGETSSVSSAFVVGIIPQAVPAGGDSGQILAKLSSTAGDIGWIDNNGIPAGGAAGDVLTKRTNEDGAVTWATPSAGFSGQYQDLENRPRINGLTLDSYTLETGDITKTTLQELDVAQITEIKAQNYYYSAALKEAYLGIKPDTGILRAPVEVPILFSVKSGTAGQIPIGYINNNYTLNLTNGETYVLKATIAQTLSDPVIKEYEGEASTDKLGVVSVGFEPEKDKHLAIGDNAMVIDLVLAFPAKAGTAFAKGSVFTAEGFDSSTKIVFESLKWKGATATNLLKQPLIPPKNAEYWMTLGYELGLKNNQMYKITVKKGAESRDYLALAQVLDIGAGGAAIPTMICYAVPNPQQTEATALKDGGVIVFYDGVNQYFVSEPNDVYMFAPIAGDGVAEDYQVRAIEAVTNVDSFALPLQFEFSNYNNITINPSNDYYFGEILKTASPLNAIAAGKTVSLVGTLDSSSGATAINGSATAAAKKDGWEIIFSDMGLYITNVFDDTNMASDEYVFIGVAFGTQGTGCTITNITVAEGE